jgi:hypothetical protein
VSGRSFPSAESNSNPPFPIVVEGYNGLAPAELDASSTNGTSQSASAFSLKQNITTSTGQPPLDQHHPGHVCTLSVMVFGQELEPPF